MHLYEKIPLIRSIKANCSEATYREACSLLHMADKECLELERLITCDQSVIEAVVEGVVDKRAAADMNLLDPADRTAVISLMRRYSFSCQMQRELLDWLPELAYRDRCTVVDILSSSWIQEIDTHEKLNAPQKIDRFRRAIFNRRFPTLARAKKRWREYASQLNPDPSRVMLKPSEVFEKNRLEIRITLTAADQAKSIFSRLSAIAPEEWNRLIYPAQTYNKFES